MNTYQFIASLVSSLAWPATVVFIIIFFKEPVTRLISSIERVNFKGFEAKFRQEIKDLKIIADTADIPLAPKVDENKNTININISDFSKASPLGAILLTWNKVEEEIENAVNELHLKKEKLLFARVASNINALADYEQFDSNMLGVIKGLRHIRNEAVHAKPGTLALTEGAVMDYIRLSERVIAYLQILKEKQDKK